MPASKTVTTTLAPAGPAIPAPACTGLNPSLPDLLKKLQWVSPAVPPPALQTLCANAARRGVLYVRVGDEAAPWPDRTDALCRHCAEPITGRPVPVVVRKAPTSLEMELCGFFHGPCALGWIADRRPLNGPQMMQWTRDLLIEEFGYSEPLAVAAPQATFAKFCHRGAGLALADAYGEGEVRIVDVLPPHLQTCSMLLEAVAANGTPLCMHANRGSAGVGDAGDARASAEEDAVRGTTCGTWGPPPPKRILSKAPMVLRAIDESQPLERARVRTLPLAEQAAATPPLYLEYLAFQGVPPPVVMAPPSKKTTASCSKASDNHTLGSFSAQPAAPTTPVIAAVPETPRISGEKRCRSAADASFSSGSTAKRMRKTAMATLFATPLQTPATPPRVSGLYDTALALAQEPEQTPPPQKEQLQAQVDATAQARRGRTTLFDHFKRTPAPFLR